MNDSHRSDKLEHKKAPASAGALRLPFQPIVFFSAAPPASSASGDTR